MDLASLEKEKLRQRYTTVSKNPATTHIGVLKNTEIDRKNNIVYGVDIYF